MPLLAFVFALLLSLLAGCAGGNSLAQKNADSLASNEVKSGPDSLRAKFKLVIVNSDNSEQNLDAVLFSVPGKRYRMELTGPMGIGVASMLWTEAGWTITFPTEKRYVKGAGYMVGLLNDSSLPLVHIHQVANIFEGKLLPEKFESVGTANADGAAADSLAHGIDALGREFSYKMDRSRVVQLNYGGRDGRLESLDFSEFKSFDGCEIPANIVFRRDGRKFLEIRVKKVNFDKPFSGGTWKLNVPRSFKPIE